MGKMDKKICLDTNVCIELLRGNIILKSRLDFYLKYPNFISSITVFELFLRKSNLEAVENFIRDFEVIPIDEYIAKKASDLFKETQKMGRMTDLRDILIASTCIINNLELATLNKKDFVWIRELRLMEI